MLLLDLFNTVYTCCMTSACKLFLEESIDHTKGNTQADYALTECQDLSVVMLSGHLSHELVGAKSASDSLVLVASL